ncbi:MAG: hypothetical protein FWC40_04485 [Proteobacteria bacterium]|nr:hypothetical protein [Pseudomonadota bacterium]
MTMNLRVAASMAAVLMLHLGGCADEVTPSTFVPDDTYYVPYKNNEDAGDCLSHQGCARPYNTLSGDYASYFEGSLITSDPNQYPNGYFGLIDADCHSYYDGREIVHGGDADYIGILAEAGTPMEILVTRTMFGAIEPVVTIYDRSGNLLLMNMAKTGDSPTAHQARVAFLAPSDARFYIAVEEHANYENSWTPACANNYRGGSRYGYIVKINKYDDLPRHELGYLSGKETFNARIDKPGEANYIFWETDLNVDKVLVSVRRRTADNRHLPKLSSLNLKDRGYLWNHTGNLVSENIEIAPLYGVPADGGQRLRFGAVVSDFNGRHGYGFEVTVEPFRGSNQP